MRTDRIQLMVKRSRRMNREDVIELLDKDDDTLEKYCSDPDEPVMSGSDDEFSNLEQENVDDTTLLASQRPCKPVRLCRIL